MFFRNWRHEPDNYDGQDCCAINEFGSFSDEYCNTKLGFICQLPLKRGKLFIKAFWAWASLLPDYIRIATAAFYFVHITSEQYKRFISLSPFCLLHKSSVIHQVSVQTFSSPQPKSYSI